MTLVALVICVLGIGLARELFPGPRWRPVAAQAALTAVAVHFLLESIAAAAA
ncbi:MAG: hypothetical protein AAGA99_27845 [Actinomycetota bacterium]